MKRREPFDLARAPLEPGVTLIEASAGTGKTFTIAGLFLRLILERDCSVREILVVTFTEAATEELRGRIRDRLAQAANALASGGATSDPVLRELLAPHLPRREVLLARLERALAGFDEAPIFTIHSFCLRTLRDRAFESGALFDTDLLQDDARLTQEIADDFWRSRVYPADELPVQFLLKSKLRPDSFLPLLRLAQRHPNLEVISRVDGQLPATLLNQLDGAFARARELWNARGADLRAAFGNSDAWAKGNHAKPEFVAGMWSALAACFDQQAQTPESLEALDFFGAAALAEDTAAGRSSPRHPFFELCDEIVGCARDAITGLRLEFLQFARQELPRRKRQLKVQTYDDLLTRLRAALQSPAGPALAAEVRAKYRAALIDEFQDTDPVQWEVFQNIFVPRNPTDSIPALFLIGDPKQAIYAFRGGDIFTYLDAAAASDQAWTLGRNFRSESPFVRAVNTIFGNVEAPFFFRDIEFRPVAAAGETDRAPLTEGNAAPASVHWWFMRRETGAKAITKDMAESVLPGIVAAEIVRLLNGPARLGDAPVRPRDIAVLVPENRHAALMQEALRAVAVPAVLHTEESVFASREALELERVLAALAQPSNERRLRAALATELLGADGPALDALARDEAGRERRRELFLTGHERWCEQGFMPMFRHWLQAAEVRPRLLRFVDGERRLTNLLHLGEVLHAAATEQRLGISGLLRWLAVRIHSLEKAAEEHQLRLERDDDAVRLVTIHKSKGLEYPIVFLPFSWRSSEPPRRAEGVLFHRREAGATRFFCDLGTDYIEANREREFEERLAENLRLLYVALTRARNRCYLIWGAFRGAATSAPAWLLHRAPQLAENCVASSTDGESGEPCPGLCAAMTTHFKSLSDAALRADLERLSAKSGNPPSISVEELPAPSAQRYEPPRGTNELLAPRRSTRDLAADWRITSFSGLVAGHGGERPDRDAEHRSRAPDTGATGLFAFPRGTQAGTCLHQVFEELDFTQADDAALRVLVESKLRLNSIAPNEFAPGVIEAVRRTLAVPLDPGRPDFTLARVSLAERLTELEFFLPLRHLSLALLQQGLAPAGADVGARLGALGFRPAGGFLRGFVDLVFRFDGRFYILDWKSNWLGNRAADYGPAALRAEMVNRFYVLQYHLYAAALHEHLKLRLPGYQYDRHFGGVFYVFLRGMDPARPELGLFRDRPTATTIERLSRALRGEAEARP